MGFLLSCSFVSITVWMDHLDANEMHVKKRDGDYTRMIFAVLNKSCKQVPKTAAIRPLTSHLTNHPIKLNKTCWRSNDELISNILLWICAHGYASVGQPARTYIHQLCTDTGCSLEDLPGMIDAKNRWWERGNSVLSVWLDEDM